MADQKQDAQKRQEAFEKLIHPPPAKITTYRDVVRGYQNMGRRAKEYVRQRRSSGSR